VVWTIDPSASMRADSRNNARGCFCHTPTRTSLRMSISNSTASTLKRRQKSPAVVGSGIVRAPSASRKPASLRRTSMSSSTCPPHNTLNAMFRM
jgi:hypothetical protein